MSLTQEDLRAIKQLLVPIEKKLTHLNEKINKVDATLGAICEGLAIDLNKLHPKIKQRVVRQEFKDRSVGFTP